MTGFDGGTVKPPFVKVRWIGHAMFLAEDDMGVRVVTDPYDESIGYEIPELEADVVTVSHGHYDHANVSAIKNDPSIVDKAGDSTAAGISFRGIPTFHDQKRGEERGENLVFTWEMGGLRLTHLGDLGHLLSEEQVEELAGTHVLFVPVGGIYTIDARGAAAIVRAISPGIAVPMHYKTESLRLPVSGVEPFLSEFDRVHRAGKDFAYISRDNLPEKPELVIFDPVG